MNNAFKRFYIADNEEVDKMAGRKRLPDAKAWKERELKDWNATTFRSYLKDQHEERYGIPYVSYNVKQEASMIKRLYEEHGKEVAKLFIDLCFDDYRPTRDYPSVNFGFMYSCMRGRILPRAIAEVRRKEAEAAEKQAIEESLKKIDELIDYM